MKRARIIALIVVGSLLGVVLFAFLIPREPVYAGRPVSEWIEQLTGGVGSGAGAVSSQALPALVQQKPGPEIVPYLRTTLYRGRSVKDRVYATLYAKLPPVILRHLPGPNPARDAELRYRAGLILYYLGADAKKAWPDLARALETIRDCGIKQAPLGFRAPSFTVVEKTSEWALETLEKYNFKYDSSVFPVGFHPDYGLPRAPLVPYRITEKLDCFEAVYVRPLNGAKVDPPGPRAQRAVQYFAYPDWNFERLREEYRDGRYESGADIGPDEVDGMGLPMGDNPLDAAPSYIPRKTVEQAEQFGQIRDVSGQSLPGRFGERSTRLRLVDLLEA